MSKEIHPLDVKLVEQLRIAKNTLAVAEQAVLDAESAIYLAAQSKLPEKGTTNFTGVKIVTGFYEKWNQEKLKEIETTWPRKSNLPFPFKREFKADGTAISYIRENSKEAYDALADALVLTPSKPSFKLVEAKE